MKKLIFSALLAFALAGCSGSDGADGENGKDANVTIQNDVEVTVSLEKLMTDENTTYELDIEDALVIVPKVIVPSEGGTFDITFIPTKDKSLLLQEKAIMIVKKINGYNVDSEWADIYYDVLREVYVVKGELDYEPNYTDKNVTSLISAVYFTDGETKNFQSAEVVQLAFEVDDPKETTNIVLDVTDGNYTVTQDENGTIFIGKD
jgi:hypothetical protein